MSQKIKIKSVNYYKMSRRWIFSIAIELGHSKLDEEFEIKKEFFCWKKGHKNVLFARNEISQQVYFGSLSVMGSSG